MKPLIAFDLDGTGRRWPWISANTFLLVWDPMRSGCVQSGAQLFGSNTWWFVWSDGYAVLAALDNDGDGRLRGDELAGIAGWTDRNGNGKSDTGEVIDVGALGIVSIATAATMRRPSGEPYAPHGIKLRDGSMLATFSWAPLARN